MSLQQTQTNGRNISNEELLDILNNIQLDVDELKASIKNGTLTEEDRNIIINNIPPQQPIIVQQSPGYYSPYVVRWRARPLWGLGLGLGLLGLGLFGGRRVGRPRRGFGGIKRGGRSGGIRRRRF